MSTANKETNAIWPGYVAAIASLVLSLLLLLAILVFAMTQVGNIVTNYTAQLMRAVLAEEEARNAITETASKTVETKSKPKTITATPEIAPNQLRFIFDADLASIPAAQASEVTKAITGLNAPPDVRWLISAAAPVDDDATERATYRLMLALRRALVEAKIPEHMIDMRMSDQITRPRQLTKGAIAIHVAPVMAAPQERQKP